MALKDRVIVNQQAICFVAFLLLSEPFVAAAPVPIGGPLSLLYQESMTWKDETGKDVRLSQWQGHRVVYLMHKDLSSYDHWETQRDRQAT